MSRTILISAIGMLTLLFSQVYWLTNMYLDKETDNSRKSLWQTGNALKYSDNDVKITVILSEHDNCVSIAIQDTGWGSIAIFRVDTKYNNPYLSFFLFQIKFRFNSV